jgi:aminoglycoside phosphotransferase family enzyme
MQQRIDHGLKRDIHGDLHSGNIFLYRKPVLFDCIEFNDEFRQIDVLYEIAFLYMDFERFHHKPLAGAFLKEYTRHFPAFKEREDHLIFTYFKCLRANIRAKVHAMQLNHREYKKRSAFHFSETGKYLSLMNEYMLTGKREI